MAATLHDPDGRFLQPLTRVACEFQRYESVVIAATITTDPQVRTVLEALGTRIEVVAAGAVGDARRSALRNASEHSTTPIFMCDLDRWLHWAIHHPRELLGLPDQIEALRPAPWYVCLGRTRRAFDTHPRVQRVAESATNDALALAIGYPVDAVAGACWFSPEGAAIVRAESIEKTAATDLEWPALIHRVDSTRLSFVATEGLEFETATYYPGEVADAGSREAWIQRVYERPEVWSERLRLAADSVSALVRIFGTPT